jgi:hypothetical protein
MIAKNVGDTERFAAAYCPPAVQRMVRHKTAIGAGSTADPAWAGDALGDYRNAVAAFVSSLATSSIFFRLIADGAFVRVPMHTRAAIVSGAATGYIVGEGLPVPVSKLQLRNQFLSELKAAALVVVSSELLSNLSAAGQILFNKELKSAVSKVVDAKFLSEMVDDSDTLVISSSGDDPMFDLRTLLLAVNTSGTPTLYFAVSPSVAKRAATLPTLFPSMTPTGGDMAGVPSVVTTAVEDGSIALIDASGIAADSNTIDLRVSQEADIEMLDNPTQDGTTGGGSSMVSMFQSNSVALQAIASFGVERLRADAIAILSGVAWGGEQSL